MSQEVHSDPNDEREKKWFAILSPLSLLLASFMIINSGQGSNYCITIHKLQSEFSYCNFKVGNQSYKKWKVLFCPMNISFI